MRTPLTVFLCLVIGTLVTACGGGSSHSSGTPNSSAITVDKGLTGAGPNLLMTNVTICVPSVSQCQAVSNVIVDTGSSGLRLMASAVPSIIGVLPVVTAGSGGVVGECTQYNGGYLFGSVRTADVKLAGEGASAVPLQIIGDSALPNVPAACSGTGISLNTVQALNANGILGIGPQGQDCGAGCVSGTDPAGVVAYYDCKDIAACAPVGVPTAQQVSNPVMSFSGNDRNGVIISLPSVPASGSAAVQGTLVFGIGTQADNTISTFQNLLTTDGRGGLQSVQYNGTSLPGAITTGANRLRFPDTTIATCASDATLFCPAAPLTASAIAVGGNGAQATITFGVTDPQAALGTQFALSQLAGPAQGSFTLGLPFFFGRTVAIAYPGVTTTVPAGTGPYIAF